ncbi:MAG: hypothetical protein WD824_26880 [Cyclobacteriaceae bacterium]
MGEAAIEAKTIVKEMVGEFEKLGKKNHKGVSEGNGRFTKK